MNNPPVEIGGTRVLYYAVFDGRCRPTGNCKHCVAGKAIEPAAGLVIGQHGSDQGYYLLYCDRNWAAVTDTWHQTLEDAMHQAEFEYDGVSYFWLSPFPVQQESTVDQERRRHEDRDPLA